LNVYFRANTLKYSLILKEKAMKDNLYEAMEARRSIYALGRQETVSEDKIISVVTHAVKYCPSAFNSQSGRVAVLFKQQHLRLWEIVKQCLKKVVPSEKFAATEAKIDSFAQGFATVLFFEDQSVVESLEKEFPLYADKFSQWSLQSSGMLQYMVWISLENEGLGASLQHYNPLIDAEVHREWKLPETWALISQMPVGSMEAPAGMKSFEAVEKRVKVFK